MDKEQIITPRASHKGFVYVRDINTALGINRDQQNFAPPAMENYLISLQAQSGIKLNNLILVSKNALFFMHGPRHIALRKETLKIFGKKNIELWSPAIEQVVNEHLTKLTGMDPIDLITAYTNPIFTIVTQKILGISPKDKDTFNYWTQQLQVLLQPLLPIRELRKMESAFQEIITQIKKGYTEGSAIHELPTLMQVLTKSQLLDFGEDDAIATAIVIYGAAINLSQTLSNIVWHILHGGDHIRKNSANTEWVLEHMEYLIKIGSSPKYIHAISAKDQIVHDIEFRKGDNVLLDLLEIHDVGCPFTNTKIWKEETMQQQQHMAFGTGIHFCIGAFLTRKVIEKCIPALFAAFPSLTSSQTTPILSENNQTVILKSLPVTIN